MIRTAEERNRTVEVANPDLGCAGVEIEGAFFGDLSLRIGRRKNLDTDFGGAGKNKGLLGNLGSVGREPSDVDGFDAAGRGDGTLCRDEALCERVGQKCAYKELPTRVRETGRGRHEDMSVLIGLDAVGQLGEVGIRQDLGPTPEIEFGLRNQIRKLNSDRHPGKILQKMERA